MALKRHIKAEELPGTVPVFAVSGAILLPGGTMPLMVFEPRYLALVDDALGAGRLLALVQPRDDEAGQASGLHDVGTLGRITAFGETGDGRYLITMAGLSRFRVAGEVDIRSGYRRVLADYSDFPADLAGTDKGPVDRRLLLAMVHTYLAGLGMATDLAQLEKADDAELTIRLAMACPFRPEEKQSLLEAAGHAERCRLMTALIERELLLESAGSSIH
ncbi:ATP-dependent protease [Paramagnetospirillum kuznetsovii]|uniref:ATP-dependent protease n=1 Tax=Paramagnetospirillum kuznetsovii TaxID=2053833 RepID=A0A364P4B0_9PROT|nr:LON peptidase substrate-binding domain-containing protein [Paramagnetospirillum kuznetsovii]RAU23997.1 ATP-dependent protease [Paramagnetospirillum kuznetsovii]